MVLQKSNIIFKTTFDRTTIQHRIAEAESTSQSDNTFNLDELISDFWKVLERKFLADYMSSNIVELFHQEIEEFPEFFVSHYKSKIAEYLTEQINKFKADFNTENEEAWIMFVEQERKNLQFWDNKQSYKPKELNLDVLRAALSIIVVLPIKAEIKHDYQVLETKIDRLQKGWGINPPNRCSWQISKQDLQIRLNFLLARIMDQTNPDYSFGVKCLH